MNGVACARKRPVFTAVVFFTLGAVAALLGVWTLGTPWKSVVEVEKVVVKEIEKPVVSPVAKQADHRRVDLIVMQKNKPLGLGSDFSEYLVEAARKIPEVERVSEGVVGIAAAKHHEGIQFLVQGWRPDNFGYEDMTLLEGRKLAD